MNRILVVDDDRKMVDFIQLHLSGEGYTVVGASDGRDALKKIEKNPVDLAVVDVMMPYMDGLSLTKELRKVYDIPVILLTARDQIHEKEEGFNAGTDDYLVKPFEPKELSFRIEALLRRYNKKEEKQSVRIGEIQINPSNYSVEINGRTLMLPLKEFELLYLLSCSPNRIFTREQLIEKIWGITYMGDTRTVDVHIKRLRERFRNNPSAFTIKTVRGVGYFMEVKGR